MPLYELYIALSIFTIYFNIRTSFGQEGFILYSEFISTNTVILSKATGSGDWATTPYVYDSKQSYLTLLFSTCFSSFV